MIGWIARILLILGGLIASLFVARDALNFNVIQMVMTILLFIILVVIISFLPILKEWFKQKK